MAEVPVETGLTGVVHTDSEYDDYIVIISGLSCHGQDMAKNVQNQIFIAIESEKSIELEKWWGFIFRVFLTALMEAFG